MKIQIDKIEKKGLATCPYCNGRGFYFSHTDVFAGDGGPYKTRHECFCVRLTK